jgi:cytochrome P450
MSELALLLGEMQGAEDPYPFYDRLRDIGRVVWVEVLGRWLVTGHREAQELFGHPAASSDRSLAEETSDDGSRPTGLPFVDPPVHTRLRSLVQQAFTARAVDRLRTEVVQLTGELLDRAEERGELDLITDFAGPLPAVVLARLLGIPTEDEALFRGWATTIIETIDPVSQRIVSDAGTLARHEMTEYLTGLVAKRRVEPRDDLISGMVHAEDAGRRLEAGELLDMCLLLAVVGLETTTNLIGNGVNALLENPDQLARLRADPGVLRTGVEELLRYDAPVQLAGRIAVRDLELGGVGLRRGQVAGIVLGAANRDPAAFADPGRLDLGRTPNPHLAFGRGIHHCLGAPLARMEGPIAIEALVRRFPALRPVGEPRRRQNVHVRGFASLPLAVR